MLSLISLMSLHAALAAAPVPVQLPAAEPQRDWPQLLAEAGLGLGAPAGWGASVTDPGDGTTWQVRLIDKSGAPQDLVVLIPTNESERADLVWYLAKLLGAELPPLEPIPPQPVAVPPLPAPVPVAQAPVAPPIPAPAPVAQAPAPVPQGPAHVAQAPAPVAAPPVAAPPIPAPAPVAAPPVQAPVAQAPVAQAPVAPTVEAASATTPGNVAPAPTPLPPEALAKIPVARSQHAEPKPVAAPQFFARVAVDASVRGQTAAAVVPELTAGVHAGLLRAGAYGALRSAAAVSGVGDGIAYSTVEAGAGVWAMPDLPVGGGLLGGVSVRSFTSGGTPVTSIAIPVVAAEALGHFALGKTGFASHIGVEPIARVQVDLRSIELQLRRGDTVNSTIVLPGWDLRLGVGFTWN
jgi:hypothetical protein